MNLPLIEKAVGAVRSWADSGGNDSEEQPVNSFKRQAPVPFARKYPKAKNPVKLTESQFNALPLRIGLSNIGKHELNLAISVIEAEEVNHVNLSDKVREVISHWRSENGQGSDEAARAKLMGNLPAVLEVNIYGPHLFHKP
jgi:hypothetical protein